MWLYNPGNPVRGSVLLAESLGGDTPDEFGGIGPIIGLRSFVTMPPCFQVTVPSGHPLDVQFDAAGVHLLNRYLPNGVVVPTIGQTYGPFDYPEVTGSPNWVYLVTFPSEPVDWVVVDANGERYSPPTPTEFWFYSVFGDQVFVDQNHITPDQFKQYLDDVFGDQVTIHSERVTQFEHPLNEFAFHNQTELWFSVNRDTNLKVGVYRSTQATDASVWRDYNANSSASQGRNGKFFLQFGAPFSTVGGVTIPAVTFRHRVLFNPIYAENDMLRPFELDGYEILGSGAEIERGDYLGRLTVEPLWL